MSDISTIETAVLTEEQAAMYLNLSKYTMRRMRAAGTGPKVCQLSRRRIGYRRLTLDQWLKEQETHA